MPRGRLGPAEAGGGPRADGDRVASAGDACSSDDAWERWLPGDDESEIDPEELRDFLAADGVEVKADPVFKEQLRARLWRIVQQRRVSPPDGGSD